MNSTKLQKNSVRTRVAKWLSGVAAVGLVASLLVVAGFEAQKAAATQPAPGVAVSQNGTYLAGEDLSLDITFTSDPAAGDEYNLSAGVVLPQGVTVVDTDGLGNPVIYTGRALPINTLDPAPRVQLPGNYSMSPTECEALGLEPLAPGQTTGPCVVPDGMHYFVFQNISDLPEGASAAHTVTLRPDAKVFPVGSRIELDITAFTSDDERFIPVFPGSTGVAAGSEHTSEPGFPAEPDRTTSVLVNALRLEKGEPSPESELLRGVHQNSTTYTIRVYHTGEGDITDTKVVDYLPAGLEYLGQGGQDHTTNANGNRGGGENSVEYDGAGRLDATPPPAGDQSTNAGVDREQSVENRQLDDAEAAALGLEPGVYTQVTWDLADLLTAVDGEMDIESGVAQNFPDDPGGRAGFLEIRYRAAIPLFENTLIFGDTTPSAESGDQGSNLDNNRGASTRHGIDDDGRNARTYVNAVQAVGSYNGIDVDDDDTESVDAVDVRLLKSVDGGGPDSSEFYQGQNARYTLNIATSEYVSAELAGTGVRPQRLVDDLGDGLCPIFPAEVDVTPGASTHDDTPQLVIGNPNPGGDRLHEDMEIGGWNTMLVEDYGVSTNCLFTSPVAGSDHDALVGATLTGIAFDPESGHFFLDLSLPENALPAGDSEGHDVQYSAAQNQTYVGGDGTDGATTSGDSVTNTAEIYATTRAIPDVSDLVNSNDVSAGDEWQAWDDSNATLNAALSTLTKKVLQREAGVPAPEDIATAPSLSDWVDVAETQFAQGDEVWYRIRVTPPPGTDVRNPKLTDFLPEGVTFDPVDEDDEDENDRPDNIWIEANPYRDLGTCVFPDDDPEERAVSWLNEFVKFDPATDIKGNVLNFTLGSSDCIEGSNDRFLPLNTTLEIYLKVRVTDADMFGQVDLAQNLAKYQQNNVDGTIFFLRDDADITVATSPRLIKGIRDIDGKSGDPLFPDANPFNSNVDDEQVVQGDDVTFRVDVTTPVRGVDPVTGDPAPNTETSGYVVWDALPDGIKKADIEGIQSDGTFNSASATLAQRGWSNGNPSADPPTPEGWLITPETPVDSDKFTAVVYDFGDSGYPLKGAVREDIWEAERSLVIWTLNTDVRASNNETELVDGDGEPTGVVVPRTERGFSLQYTVVVPDGSTETAEALVKQRYENTASIVSYQPTNNAGSGNTSTIIMTGDDVLSTTLPDPENSNEFGTSDNGTFDNSDVYLPDLDFSKRLVSTEIGSTSENANRTVGLTQLDGTRNNQAQIVQGEYATFEYALTVPAHTSVSGAVLSDGGSLARPSDGLVRYEFVGGGAEFFGPGNTTSTPNVCDEGELAGFECEQTVGTGSTATHGVLTFPTAEPYQNDTEEPQTFRVRVTVWMKDRDNDPANSAVTQIRNNIGLTNTATVSYDNPAFGEPGESEKLTQTANATTTFVEPNPTLTKIVTDPAATGTPPEHIVDIDGEATYLLTASNQNNRPALYDSVVIDCVPGDLAINEASLTALPATTAAVLGGPCSVSGNTITEGSGNGQLIVWTIGQINGTGTTNAPTLTYKAKAKNDVGSGLAMRNVARLDGHTLPEPLEIDGTDRNTDERRGFYTRTDDASVRMVEAALSKSVATPNGLGSAPVGETLRYTLDIDLPPHANFYDVELTDLLPAGLKYDEDGEYDVNFTHWDEGPPNTEPSVLEPAVTGTVAAGQTLTWAITPDDIGLHTEMRTISVSFDAIITDEVIAAAPTNSAAFSWNQVNGDESTRSTSRDTAQITILNPVMQVVKKVDGENSIERNPDASFDYTLTVSQTSAGNTPAYNVTVVDEVPVGVIVDPASIETVQGVAGQLTGTNPDGNGGTITWAEIPGPLHPEAGAGTPKSIELGYSGSFLESADLKNADFPYENIVNVTKYESFGEDGWVYIPPVRNPDGPPTSGGTNPGGANVPAANDDAEVTPIFPFVTLDKAVADGDIAYVDASFGWRLTLVNTDRGDAQDISLEDLLPANWEYDAGSARISIGGGAFVELDDPTIAPAGELPVNGAQTLTWNSADLRVAGDIGAASPVLPGVASNATAEARTIVITFDATPNEHALADAGVGMTVNHTNTFSATVTDTTDKAKNGDGPYVEDEDTANAHIADADLTIAKTGATDPIMAGTTGVAWSIVVSNNGPDTAEGSIKVSDVTEALPEGITVTGASGTGWACDPPSEDPTDSGIWVFECERAEPADVLANEASFEPIDVTVAVAQDQEAVTGLKNIAMVIPGKTHDSDPDNNEDNATFDTDMEADLAIEKTLVTANPNAGSTITWTLSPSNIGPSVSVSDDTPITITDEVPVGIFNVGDPSVAAGAGIAGWIAALNGAAWPAGATATAGDTITWTYVPADPAEPWMPVGAAPSITLEGTIEPAWVGGDITNIAEIIPGDTDDPNPDNNEDSVSTDGITDNAVINIAKTRVVLDGGTWRNATAGDVFNPGDPISYRIDVVNHGDAEARNVVVVDEAPDELTYDSTGFANVEGAWTPSSGPNADGWYSFIHDGNLGVDVTHSFRVTYNSDPAHTDLVMNTARVTSDNTPPAEDSESTDSDRLADLTITKTHSGDPISGVTDVNDLVEFTLVVENLGPSDSSAPVEVRDVLPDGLSYATGTATVDGVLTEPDDITGQTLTWDDVTEGADLAFEGTVTITFKVLIDADVAEQTLTNNAYVDGPEDPTPGNNHDDDEIEVTTSSVMTIVKDVEPGPWVAGTVVTYTVTVANNGPSYADGVSVTDTILDSGVTLKSINPVPADANWDCPATLPEGAITVLCDYDGRYPVSGSTTFEVVGAISPSAPITDPAEDPLVNEAVLKWSDSDGDYFEDDDAGIWVTTQADLRLVKTAVDETGDQITSGVAGETIRYALEVDNLGPSDADAVLTVVDTLPVGISYIDLVDGSSGFWEASPDPVDPVTGEQTVTFTPRVDPDDTTLAAGATAPPIVFEVLLDAALPVTNPPTVDPLVNTAIVSSGTDDPDPSNNEDDEPLDIEREVDVSIEKWHDADQVRIGDVLPFHLQVTNHGPSNASGVTVTDTVPQGLEVLIFAQDLPLDMGNGWTVSDVIVEPDGDTTVVARYADELTPGESAEILTIPTEVTAVAYDTVTNIAEVTIEEDDRDPENNRTTDVVTIPPMVELVIEKTAVGQFKVGETGTYRIDLTNNGPTEDPGPVIVTDVLPKGLTFASSPDEMVAVNGDTVTWTLEDGIQVGEEITLTLVVNVGRAAYPNVTNVVSVDSEAEKTPESILSDPETVEVEEADPLAMTGADFGQLALLALILLLLAGGTALVIKRRKDVEISAGRHAA